MSSAKEENQIYNLTKIEDVFACLEATAMAQAALMSIDPEAAASLEKVTEALGALSLVIEMGDLVQVVEKIVEVEKIIEVEKVVEVEKHVKTQPPAQTGPINDLVDFVTPAPDYSSVDTPSSVQDEEEDVIIDILTGERIR